MTIETEVCHQCNGRGTVELFQHTPTCGIRCSPECPRVTMAKCPACAARELGDDLS